MTTPSSSTASTGEQAKQAAQDVASTAKDQAVTVLDETKHQANRVTEEVRQQVSEQVQQQRGQAVSALRKAGDELGSLPTDEHSRLTQQIVQMSSERLRDVATYLDTHGPEDMLEGLRSFARRRPMMFLFAAGIAGVVAGRAFRSATSSQEGSSHAIESSMPSQGLHAQRPDVALPEVSEPVYTSQAYGYEPPEIDVTDEQLSQVRPAGTEFGRG
jgi:hypothetical protein